MTQLLQHIATDFIGVVICIFLFCLTGRGNNLLSRRTGNRFIGAVWMVFFCCVAEMFTIVLEWIGDPAFNAVDLWLNAATEFLYVFVMLQMSYVFDDGLEQHRRVITGSYIAYMIFIIIATAQGWLFTVTGATIYCRGPLLFPSMIFPGAALILLVHSSYKLSSKYAHIRDGYIAMMVFFLCLNLMLQVVFYGLLLIWPTISLMMMLFYIYLRETSFMIDPVTSIMNRAAFERRIKKAEHISDVAILIFDLNNLKEVNDASGHSEGDMYLSTAARYISEAFDSHGFTFRIGGDEFGTIAYRISEDEIQRKMNDLDLRCASVDFTYPLSFAHGYAIRNKDDRDLRATMKRADDQMYYLSLIHI